MKKIEARSILKALEEIHTEGLLAPEEGICWNVYIITGIDVIVGDHLNKYFMSWPHYSGDICYPIPNPNKVDSPTTAYENAQESGAMWDTETEYGRLRHNLLEYLIECLREEVNHD